MRRPSDRTRTVFYRVDNAGRLESVKELLTGTLPLDRHHENPAAAIAPAPQGASADGLITRFFVKYDDLDNVIRIERPQGQCSLIEYDPEFAQYPLSYTAYLGGCGFAGQAIAMSWDAGFGLPTAWRAPSGASVERTYDAFGRLSELRLPDPQTGLPSDQPIGGRSLRIFTSIEVVEDAEKLIESVIGGQMLITVAKVVLTELTSGVAKRLQHLGEGRIAFLDPLLRARESDSAQTGAHRIDP